MLTRNRYGYFDAKCTWDDLYLVHDRKAVVKVITVSWNPKREHLAQISAERICRWLNRKPPLPIRFARILTRFDPTGNHDKFHNMSDIANYLYADMEDNSGG